MYAAAVEQWGKCVWWVREEGREGGRERGWEGGRVERGDAV